MGGGRLAWPTRFAANQGSHGPIASIRPPPGLGASGRCVSRPAGRWRRDLPLVPRSPPGRRSALALGWEYPEPRGGQAYGLTDLQGEVGQLLARQLDLEVLGLGVAVYADEAGQLNARDGAADQHAV